MRGGEKKGRPQPSGTTPLETIEVLKPETFGERAGFERSLHGGGETFVHYILRVAFIVMCIFPDVYEMRCVPHFRVFLHASTR